MLRVVYGAKGSGKTQKLIDEANLMVEKTSGNIVFITYVDRYNFELNCHIPLRYHPCQDPARFASRLHRPASQRHPRLQ